MDRIKETELTPVFSVLSGDLRADRCGAKVASHADGVNSSSTSSSVSNSSPVSSSASSASSNSLTFFEFSVS